MSESTRGGVTRGQEDWLARQARETSSSGAVGRSLALLVPSTACFVAGDEAIVAVLGGLGVFVAVAYLLLLISTKSALDASGLGPAARAAAPRG